MRGNARGLPTAPALTLRELPCLACGSYGTVATSAASQPFLLRALSYIKRLATGTCRTSANSVDGGGSKKRNLTGDPLKCGRASQPGHGMVNRFTTAQSTAVMRRWAPSAIVTLAAMAALIVPIAGAAPRDARRAPTEAAAPRDAGEP